MSSKPQPRAQSERARSADHGVTTSRRRSASKSDHERGRVLTADQIRQREAYNRSIEKVEKWRRQCGFPPVYRPSKL